MSNGPRTTGARAAESGKHSQDGLCAVVLAAGAGTRLRPLTANLPKAMCPVGGVPLLEQALARAEALGLRGRERIAVNAHHHAEKIVDYVGDRAHLSVEQPEALGTAGAVGALLDWVAGRDVLVLNADAYLDGDVGVLLPGPLPDGGRRACERLRLLVVPDQARGDFGTDRFAGVSLLPWHLARSLRPVPTGLYEVVWRAEVAAGRTDLVRFGGTFVDCGTVADYLAANLHTSAGASVVGSGATVHGTLTRSVVWPGGHVAAGEHLVDAVRTDDGTTAWAENGVRRGVPAEA
jgi:MurNAc alpha-1-phosphate uridylyltransferase